MGCKAKVDTSCGEGLHFEPGKGCVSAAPAPVPTTGGPSSAVPIAAVPPAQAEQSQASDVQALVTVTTKALELRQPIAFQLYRAGIPPQSFPILDAVVAVLGAQPSIRLRVEGHTDSIGSDERNLRLSQERADAVCKYLVDRGVDPARLEAKGYGPQRPIASNRSAEGRAMNARVDRSGSRSTQRPAKWIAIQVRADLASSRVCNIEPMRKAGASRPWARGMLGAEGAAVHSDGRRLARPKR